MPFEVRISKKADGELSELARSGDKKLVGRIIEALERLGEDPYTPRPHADILQLEAVDPKMWRLRIGHYRILYSVDDTKKIVSVTTILHRKRSYR